VTVQGRQHSPGHRFSRRGSGGHSTADFTVGCVFQHYEHSATGLGGQGPNLVNLERRFESEDAQTSQDGGGDGKIVPDLPPGDGALGSPGQVQLHDPAAVGRDDKLELNPAGPDGGPEGGSGEELDLDRVFEVVRGRPSRLLPHLILVDASADEQFEHGDPATFHEGDRRHAGQLAEFQFQGIGQPMTTAATALT
jgi:hypothetical protein